MSRRTECFGKSPCLQAGERAPTVTFANALAQFFGEDLDPRYGTSRNTIYSYKSAFRLLIRFLEQQRPELLEANTPIKRIDSSVLEQFLNHLCEDRGCAPSTINVRLAALCALARSLERRYPHLSAYCRSILAIPARRAPEPLVGYFELNELKAIFDAVDTSTPDGFRDLVLLRCLYNTGARASELCSLYMEDLRLEEPAHMVLRGKGGKVRTVPLWQLTADLLRAYIRAARRKPKPGYEEFVFIGRKGKALTRHGLYRIARRYIEEAAKTMPRLSRKELHPVCSFRHTTATHLLMAGESITIIQEILGHARLDTTRRYRAVSLDRKRSALQRLLKLRDEQPDQQKAKEANKAAWSDSQDAIDWLESL